jgi:hypothetical protein
MPSANSRFLPKRLADQYFGSGSFKFLLVSSIPTETHLDTWDFRNDVTNEVTGAGYTSGGVAVSVSVGSVDTTNNRVAVTIADLTPGWATATITAVGGWLYKDTGNAATDELIQFVDFGATVSSTAAAFNVDFTTPLYINA